MRKKIALVISIALAFGAINFELIKAVGGRKKTEQTTGLSRAYKIKKDVITKMISDVEKIILHKSSKVDKDYSKSIFKSKFLKEYDKLYKINPDRYKEIAKKIMKLFEKYGSADEEGVDMVNYSEANPVMQLLERQYLDQKNKIEKILNSVKNIPEQEKRTARNLIEELKEKIAILNNIKKHKELAKTVRKMVKKSVEDRIETFNKNIDKINEIEIY